MSRRRRTGPVEDILIAFSELPFWVSIVGAICFYLGLRYLPPLLAGTSLVGTAFASFLPQLAPWAAIATLLAGLVGVAKRQGKRLLLMIATKTGTTRRLEWPDFERLVGEVYRRRGYIVTERGGPYADGGIDLELRRAGDFVIVQCKHWRNRQVPVQRVRELLGVVTAEGADRGVLVATGGFTREAQEFAVGKSIELIDEDQLLKLANSIRDQPRAAIQHLEPASRPQEPTCPLCGKSMVRRTARRGSRAGSNFWGCSSYPACHGTRAA